MSTLTLQLPDSLELSPKETVRFLAAKLYESDAAKSWRRYC